MQNYNDALFSFRGKKKYNKRNIKSVSKDKRSNLYRPYEKRNFRRYVLAKIIHNKNYFHRKLKTIRKRNFSYLQKKKFERFTRLDRAAIAKGILLYLKKRKKSVITVSKPVNKALNVLKKKIGKLKKFLRGLDRKKEKKKKIVIISKKKRIKYTKLNNKILRFKRQCSFKIFKEKLKVFLKDRLNDKKSDVWGSRLLLLVNNFNLLSYLEVVFTSN